MALNAYQSSVISQILGISPDKLSSIASGRFDEIQTVLVDTFKANTDPDDTLSFVRAIAANATIFLGSRTYLVSSISVANTVSSFSMIGVPGASIIQRTSNSGGGAFCLISSPNVVLDGITFDYNKANVSGNQWGCLIRNLDVPQTAIVRNCTFKNNSGTIGSGISLVGAYPAVKTTFEVSGCEVFGCSWNAIYMASMGNGRVLNNYVHDNTGTGILVTVNGTANATNLSSDILIASNQIARCYRGIQSGAISPPYVFGTPTASHITMSGNQCQDITNYSIIGQGDHIDTLNNRINQSNTSVPVNTGIGYTGRYGTISGNEIIFSGSAFCIDIGGSLEVRVEGNHVTHNSGSGINIGGGTNLVGFGNHLNTSGTGFAFTAYEVEGDGSGAAFPSFCSGLVIDSNLISLNGSGSRGIATFDNPGGRSGANPTFLTNNRFITVNGASQSICFQLAGGGLGAFIRGNTVNALDTMFINPNASGDIVYYEVYDTVSTFAGSNTIIRSVISDYTNIYNGGGSILWVYPTAGGSGYTANTTLAASGTGGGSGWTGTPLISNGVIQGVKTTAVGSGYSGTLSITATDSVGNGATFSLTNIPFPYYNRELKVTSLSVTNLLKASGGAVGFVNPDYPIIIRSGDFVILKAARNTNKWIVISEPKVHFAVGSLPVSNSSYTNAMVYVTGSTTAKWHARNNGTNWIWSDGTTVST